ncbi:MAG: flavin reductase family protein [Planctomycetota bacterium]
MKKSFGPKTLLYPPPVWVIGTFDKDGEPNVMTASWAGICCSDPPCVAVSLRKATYTYTNIQERKAFTVNIPSAEHVKEADYFGIVSGKREDKFAATGLMPRKSSLVDAPYVNEFPMVIECKLLKTVEIGLHTQFIGQIMDVKVDETVLDERGIPDMEKVKPFVFGPVRRAYYAVGGYLAKAFSVGKALSKGARTR